MDRFMLYRTGTGWKEVPDFAFRRCFEAMRGFLLGNPDDFGSQTGDVLGKVVHGSLPY